MLLLFWSAPAFAQETSSLHWVRLPGAEACVGGHDLAQAVEAELGHSIFVSASEAELAVEGRVEPQPEHGGFRAVLAVSNREGALLGERTIESQAADCTEFTPALAVVIALLIDPDAEHAAPVDEPEEGVVETPEQPDPEPPPPSEWHVVLEGGTGISAGLAPVPLWTLIGSVILETPWLVALEVGGRLSPIGGDAADLVLAMGKIAACFVPELDARFHLHACGGFEAGVVFVSAGGNTTEHLLVNGELHMRGSIDLVGPLEIWLVPTFVVPFRHDVHPEAEPFAVAFVGEAGFGLRL
jgi:hypothetical protein